VKKLLKVNLSSILILGLFAFMPEIYGQQKEIEMRALTESSDLIVVGKVLKTKAEWGVDKKRIYTNVTILVDEFVKGSQGNNYIIVSHPGGEIGEVGELYSDVPSFSKDEELILFIKKDNNSNLIINGGNSGKVSVNKDKLISGKMTVDDKPIDSVVSKIKKMLQK